MNGEQDPSQMSLTFFGEFADFCRETGAEAYVVTSYSEKQIFRDAEFVIENRPKARLRSGLWYHLSEISYGIGLFITALRYRANVAVLNSGSTHYFVMSLFRLAGMRVVPIMHNTLWPCGSPPSGAVKRVVGFLDRLFFQLAATSVIGVSPECLRQVHQITDGKHCPLYEMKIQFRREYFETLPLPPSHDQRPFRIMFSGRITEDKGVFDLLEIAKEVHARIPNRVAWEICGDGPDLGELRARQSAMNLGPTVVIRGWTPPLEMRQVISKSHLAIVPTRQNFAEGMAMAAIEPVLAGRPVITNPVVPALEVLRKACIEAKANDVNSYALAVLNLLKDGSHYRELCASCPSLSEQFYNRQLGFRATLHKAIGDQNGARGQTARC